MDRGFLNLEWYLQYRISWSSKAYCACFAQLAFSVMLKWQFNIVLYTVRLLNLYYLAGKKSRLPACLLPLSIRWMNVALRCFTFLAMLNPLRRLHSALTQSRAGTICVDPISEESHSALTQTARNFTYNSHLGMLSTTEMVLRRIQRHRKMKFPLRWVKAECLVNT